MTLEHDLVNLQTLEQALKRPCVSKLAYYNVRHSQLSILLRHAKSLLPSARETFVAFKMRGQLSRWLESYDREEIPHNLLDIEAKVSAMVRDAID